MMKKPIFVFAFIVLAIFLIVFAVVLSGNQFTVARCVVSDNGTLYMAYHNRPVLLSYNHKTEFETGDKLLILHQTAFAESYPEQTRAYFIVKISSGTENDVPSEVIDVLTQLKSI